MERHVKSGQNKNLIRTVALGWEITTTAETQMAVLEGSGAIPLIQKSVTNTAMSQNATQLSIQKEIQNARRACHLVPAIQEM